MSEYIKKIEQDYNDGNIKLAEISRLRNEFDKLSDSEKEKLNITHRKKEVDSKTNKPQPKVNYQEQVVNLLRQQNSDISTIKNILLFYLVLFLILMFAYAVILSQI